ncbi:hypothetical protein [Cupriavidus sp. RAF12]|uniref:hypothetical protein n=1 Tax=Cupriavidus sp. RAF12 TaxID=3233050 RepID=UPI003F8EA294
MGEIFECSVRVAGDLAGVFEFDGEAGYFYLCSVNSKAGHRVKGAIQLFAGAADLSEEDVLVKWDVNERFVGLLLKGTLWAAFDGESGAKFGGGYNPTAKPMIPDSISCRFHAH